MDVVRYPLFQSCEQRTTDNEQRRRAQALGALRESKGKSVSLYELPWYIIIGPPGAGKTTVIANSGLNFPLSKKFGKEALRGVGGTDAVWTSKPLDAGLRAHFGLLSWTASGPIELSTRSGNTQQPDDTWSAWSDGLTQPGMTKSPPARYVQVRARWTRDPRTTLSDVTLPFVTDNLRAVLAELM